jgi:hypothetical protein
MGVVGSMGINVGQNIQARGLEFLEAEQRAMPWRSVQWRWGLCLFISFSILNFAALAFAPASILTPLESIQFVTNIVWNRFVNKRHVGRRMIFGVSLAMVGTVVSVTFGAAGSPCRSLRQLEACWLSSAWLVYLAGTFLIAALAQSFHAVCTRQWRATPAPPRIAVALPVAYTLASALAGGAQMIVHSKVVSELLAMLFQGDTSVFTAGIFYLELVLVIGCGVIWAWRLTACLALYDPLVILPLMVGTYILFGGIAGGIFFGEFAQLHMSGVGGPLGRWVLYVSGMLLVLLGLGFIATAGARSGVMATAKDDVGDGDGPPTYVKDKVAPGDSPKLHAPAALSVAVQPTQQPIDIDDRVVPFSVEAEAADRLSSLANSRGSQPSRSRASPGSRVSTPHSTDAAAALSAATHALEAVSRVSPQGGLQAKVNRIKELAVVVATWSEREQRLSRVVSSVGSSVSPGAPSMPTPNAVVLSAARLSGVRHRKDSARWDMAESVRESLIEARSVRDSLGSSSPRGVFAESPAAAQVLSGHLEELAEISERSQPPTPAPPRPTPLPLRGGTAGAEEHRPGRGGGRDKRSNGKADKWPVAQASRAEA